MHGQSSGGRSQGGMNDRTGQPGVESALGRDRTRDGDLPPDMGTNRMTTGMQEGSTGDGSSLNPRQIAGQAQQGVGQAVGFAQEQVTQRLGSQIGQVSESLELLSRSVSSMGHQLRRQDQGMMAQAVEMAAHRIEGMSRYLRNRDLDEIVRDTERFARRQPMLFMGGALTLGMLASRFLKASAPESPQPYYQERYYPSRMTGSGEQFPTQGGYAPQMPYASQPGYAGTPPRAGTMGTGTATSTATGMGTSTGTTPITGTSTTGTTGTPTSPSTGASTTTGMGVRTQTPGSTPTTGTGTGMTARDAGTTTDPTV